MLEEFWDEEQGGFFFTGKSHETLIERTKSAYDQAIPSGTAIATKTLLRLYHYTGQSRLSAAGRAGAVTLSTAYGAAAFWLWQSAYDAGLLPAETPGNRPYRHPDAADTQAMLQGDAPAIHSA